MTRPDQREYLPFDDRPQKIGKHPSKPKLTYFFGSVPKNLVDCHRHGKMTMICICSMFLLISTTANAARVGLLRVGVPSNSSGGTSSSQLSRPIETSRTLRDEEFDVYVHHQPWIYGFVIHFIVTALTSLILYNV
jgi:hypothetical protein